MGRISLGLLQWGGRGGAALEVGKPAKAVNRNRKQEMGSYFNVQSSHNPLGDPCRLWMLAIQKWI